MTKRNKYNRAPKEQRTAPDGTVYDSKREMEYAAQLDLLKRAGAIQDWQRQIKFPLSVGKRDRQVIGNHIVDFKVVHNDGHVGYVEVKGIDLPLGRWKRRHCEFQYGIKIEVVK